MTRLAFLSLGLCAALPACAGAQEIAVRLTEIPAAEATPVFAAAAPSLIAAPLPAAALPTISLPAALASAPGSPEVKRAAPPAAGVPARNAAPEAARADAARMWDGGSAAPSPELAPLVRAAEPFRTENQLARLAANPRPAGASYRFAVIGDAEPGRFWFSRALFNRDREAFWTKLLPRADRSGADFIVQLGDMVSRGIPRNFRAFFARLRAAAPRTPYLTVIGNHDRRSPHGETDSVVYRALFGPTDYSFERAGRRFVVVDNSAGKITPAQLDWLRSQLSGDKPAIVFTHMPPAPLTEWTDFGALGTGGFKDGAREFMRLMSERKVARVYMGHVHGFGVLERGGVRYVLTGGGGSPLFPGPVKQRFHHYLTVDDGPDGIVETVHRADGNSFRLP